MELTTHYFFEFAHQNNYAVYYGLLKYVISIYFIINFNWFGLFTKSGQKKLFLYST